MDSFYIAYKLSLSRKNGRMLFLIPQYSMNKKFIIPVLFSCILFLSACSTTVVTEEDRALPPEPPKVVVEESSSSSESSESSEEVVTGPETFVADMSQSFIAFVGSKGDLVSHEGKFEDFSFSLKKENGEPTSTEISIAIDSMVTDSDGLTRHLLNQDFFDAPQHPTATFVSDSFEAKGRESYAVTGDLTIKGVTQTITVDASVTDTYLVSTFEIDRTNFAVGNPPGGPKSIDAGVPIEVKVVFKN